MNYERLRECPNCGLEFEQVKPNYSFCSYACYKVFMDKQRRQIRPSFDAGIVVNRLIYTELWWRGYRPSLNWHRWDDDDGLFDEFVRLMVRDEEAAL